MNDDEKQQPKGWRKYLVRGSRLLRLQAREQQSTEKGLLSSQPLLSPRVPMEQQQQQKPRWDQLAELYPFLLAKSSFECHLSEDYRHLFFLLRNLEAAEVGLEGKIPALCLGERQIVEAIAVLQKMLGIMRQGQVDLSVSQEVMSLFFPDLNDSSSALETPLPQGISEEDYLARPIHSDPDSGEEAFRDFDEVIDLDEEEEGEWNEDEEDGDNFTTDDGIGYPHCS